MKQSSHMEQLFRCVLLVIIAQNASANYKGVAKVTCRRARKGFEIKYNPDSHWSNAFYQGLDTVQYKDGRDKLLLNRDDLSAFRLDSMCTSNKAPTHCMQGQPALTTKTDYQARYHNTLQTTSYNFTASENTGEVCIGVVKSRRYTHKRALATFGRSYVFRAKRRDQTRISEHGNRQSQRD